VHNSLKVKEYLVISDQLPVRVRSCACDIEYAGRHSTQAGTLPSRLPYGVA